MWRLLASGERHVYPVNPNVSEVMGRAAYARIIDIPEPIDLAVIVVRSSQVPTVLQECIQKGVKAAVVISGGFAETGEPGTKLQAELVKIARQGAYASSGPIPWGMPIPHRVSQPSPGQ